MLIIINNHKEMIDQVCMWPYCETNSCCVSVSSSAQDIGGAGSGYNKGHSQVGATPFTLTHAVVVLAVVLIHLT